MGGPLLAALLIGAFAEPGPEQVSRWADCLGTALSDLAMGALRRQDAEAGFRGARVLPVRGPELLATIAREIERMMRIKIAAVQELVDRAEYEWRQSPYEIKRWPLFHYKDAKRLNVTSTNPFLRENIDLKENGHFFGARVNTSYSAVHVPTHVYDGGPRVLRGLEWSEGLDEVFVENYRKDPTLYWQYFGSAMGFMRRYPASRWEPKPAGEVDVFDCRTRAWYIEAASSPKDVIILVDNSGSMTGDKRALARNVVFEILDTLGSNDFVNIFSFHLIPREVVCCFTDRLVQANLANIRDLKRGMLELEAPNNYTILDNALNEAFMILQDYRENRRGSNCNQAIMLITDGSPETFVEVFEKWNWNQESQIPVRMFTYLIGQEADLRETKWMACANRGYFVHISFEAEVRENVLQYVSVMGRPLVLNNTYHPVVWSPVYADIVDPKMTDYLWELKEREIQKGLSWLLRHTKVFRKWKDGGYKEKKGKDKTFLEIVDMAISQDDIKDDREYLIDTRIKRYPYKMMTSVSMPVYDTRDNYSIEATVLGVAGTDVPNFEIQRLMVPYMLGVNGYAFIVTNNGYTIIHPELRPEFQVSINGETVSILKPNFNNIDFMDVELPFKTFSEEFGTVEVPKEEEGVNCSRYETVRRKTKTDLPCRKDDSELLALREKLINRVVNGSSTLMTKNHYDGLRRVYFNRKHFYYTPIRETPFELVIVLPDGYGQYRVESKPEVVTRQNPRRNRLDGKGAFDFFKDQNWKIHPNWYYCKYHFRDTIHFNSPEEELMHFLNKSGLKFPKTWRESPDHYHCHICNSFRDISEKSNFYCDKNLVLSLLYDAKATERFTENLGQEIKHKLGLVLVFIATRSGLTRWQDVHPDHKSEAGSSHFSETYKSAIDETWYKRAVEQYLINPKDVVYSVPYNAGDDEDTLVTATQAVFLANGTSMAPAAVVGFQFKQIALHTLFTNITYSTAAKSVKTCESTAYDCYILDNHAYVVVSENLGDTGKFFGEIQGHVMERMVQEKIYRRVEVHDYQAVCFVRIPKKPKKKVYNNKLYINRTRPQPCETKVNLYTLNNKKVKSVIPSLNCTRPFFAKDIAYSNLILVVVNSSCPLNKSVSLLAQPEEIPYKKYWCCKTDRNLSRNNVAECANYDKQEGEIKNVCGNAPGLLSSMLVLIISMMSMQPVQR